VLSVSATKEPAFVRLFAAIDIMRQRRWATSRDALHEFGA